MSTQRNNFVQQILQRLDDAREDLLAQWAAPTGTNTRHFFVDDLLSHEDCRAIYDAFPRSGDGFFSRESFREKKRTSASLSSYDPILADITYAIQDTRVIAAVEELTGLNEIEPDPKLYAGGLSMMFRDDFLNPHIDNSHDAERQRYRRLNLLYYVSPDWDVSWGGNLELWDDDVQTPKTMHSAFNRLVVMETNKASWHSVSAVKADRPRCCVSNYYFSKTSPDNSEYFHVTSFTGRPDQNTRRAIGVIDNTLRNVAARTLRMGRGKDLVNKDS